MPAISASTPAPVMAEPKNTGCTARGAGSAGASARAAACSAGRPRRTRRAARRRARRARSTGRRRPAVDRRGAGCRCRAPTTSRRPPGSAGRRSRRDSAASRAPVRSILLTKISVGMRSRCRVRISTRVCACTPSTAEITRTAPSSTPSTRSTSAMKSGWPGVSIRLTRDVADRERHHRGLDGDAAAAFQLERVGPGAAGVDAADLVDHTGGVQQPLGEAGLTGVDVREDAEIERSQVVMSLW